MSQHGPTLKSTTCPFITPCCVCDFIKVTPAWPGPRLWGGFCPQHPPCRFSIAYSSKLNSRGAQEAGLSPPPSRSWEVEGYTDHSPHLSTGCWEFISTKGKTRHHGIRECAGVKSKQLSSSTSFFGLVVLIQKEPAQGAGKGDIRGGKRGKEALRKGIQQWWSWGCQDASSPLLVAGDCEWCHSLHEGLRSCRECWVTGCPAHPPSRTGTQEEETHCSGDSNTVAMNGRVDFPKKKLAHQCPGSALGSPGRSKVESGRRWPSAPLLEALLHSPGWWGMVSPGHSALPQELLLEVEPRRPAERRGH